MIVAPPPTSLIPFPHLQAKNVFFRFGLDISKLELLSFRLLLYLRSLTHVSNIDAESSALCRWLLFCILRYTVLASELDFLVSVEQIMSLRSVKERQNINYMCFEEQPVNQGPCCLWSEDGYFFFGVMAFQIF